MPRKPKKTVIQTSPADTASPKVEPPDISGFYEEVGGLIGFYRRKAGLKQWQLADKINLTRASVTNIEGAIQKPLPHTLFLIAWALQINVEELFPSPTSVSGEFKKVLDALAPEHRKVIERFVRQV